MFAGCDPIEEANGFTGVHAYLRARFFQRPEAFKG